MKVSECGLCHMKSEGVSPPAAVAWGRISHLILREPRTHCLTWPRAAALLSFPWSEPRERSALAHLKSCLSPRDSHPRPRRSQLCGSLWCRSVLTQLRRNDLIRLQATFKRAHKFSDQVTESHTHTAVW